MLHSPPDLANVQAELARLRQQCRTFDTALSHTPDFAYIFDLDGRFTYANRALLALWQKTMEEVLGKNFFDLGYPGDLAERLQRQIQQVIQTKAIIRDETAYTGANGESGEYEYIFVPVFGADGAIVSVTGSTRDITARKQTEAALRESEQLFNAAFSEAPVGMILMTPDGEFLEANRTYLDMLGYTREEIASRTSDRITHPDDIEATHQFGEAFRQGKQRTGVLEKRYLRKNGQILWARAAGTMRYDANGKATQFIAIIEDITQQKRAEDALRNSEERLQLIFEQAPVAVCVLRGPELVFELVNPYYQRLFPGRALLGKPLLEVVPEVSPELLEILRQVRVTGQPYAAEECLIPLDRNLDGVLENYWFNFVYHPLNDPYGATIGVVAVSVDVTSSMKARQGLERANRNLEEFAYVASHDLQEPLRMVNIYTQLLVRGLGQKDEAQLRQYADQVMTGANRMEALLRDLLDYSRTDHGEEDDQASGRADLNIALHQAMALAESRINECQAELVISVLPIVVGNETQLTHVFQNLLTNSLKYRNPDTPPRIEISAILQDGECIVSVRDNGIGFNQTHADRVFGLFKRLHNRDKYPGTGLGLAICKRIVERYRGRMWVESQEGAGATFYFALPEAPHE